MIVAGIVMIVASRWIPRRTAKGYAVLRHVDGFRRFIEESEKDRAQFAEKKNLFTEYLPYAIVFGATEKWAHAFAGLGDEPPDTSSWYVSQQRVQLPGVLGGDQQLHGRERGHLGLDAPVDVGFERFVRLLRRRLLGRWRWRRWRRLLVARAGSLPASDDTRGGTWDH